MVAEPTPIRPPTPGSLIPPTPQDVSDGWATDRNEYAPYKFYVHGTKDKVTLQVGLPPYHAEIIQQLVWGDKLPHYRTAQDFIRDAVMHRLMWLKIHEPQLLDEVGLASIERAHHAADMRRGRVEREEFDQIVADLEQNLDHDHKVEDYEGITTLVGEAEMKLRHLNTSEKARLEAVLERFRPLIEEQAEGGGGDG